MSDFNSGNRGGGGGGPRDGQRGGREGGPRDRNDRGDRGGDRGDRGGDFHLQERPIGRGRRVAKVVKGGRRFSHTSLVVVGDGAGRVGLGYGKGKEHSIALQKATENAKKNVFDVPLAGATIIHPITGVAG